MSDFYTDFYTFRQWSLGRRMDTGFGEKYEYLKCTFNPLVASSNLARPTKYSNPFKTPHSFLCGVFSCALRLGAMQPKDQASSFSLSNSSDQASH